MIVKCSYLLLLYASKTFLLELFPRFMIVCREIFLSLFTSSFKLELLEFI